jgi:hypothetical protein
MKIRLFCSVIVLVWSTGCTPSGSSTPPPRAAAEAAGKEELLARALRWYKDDYIWEDCVWTAGRLTKDGFPTTPLEVLLGSIEVMERLRVKPDGSQTFREYGSIYDSYRRDDPREAGSGPATHQRAIDVIVENEKFGSSYDQAEDDARRVQPLVVGQEVSLCELGRDFARFSPEGSSDFIPKRVPAGTRAVIEEIVPDSSGELGMRWVIVRIKDGEYAGQRGNVGLSQIQISASP